MTGVAAAVVGIAGAAATAYSAYSANSAAKKQQKAAQKNVDQAREYDLRAIEARQTSPAAKFAPIFTSFGIDVFGKAFSNHGFTLPAEQIKQAMGLDRIIRNNAEGLPWNANEKERDEYNEFKTRSARFNALARVGGVGQGPEAGRDERSRETIGGDVGQAQFAQNMQPTVPSESGQMRPSGPAAVPTALPSYGGAMRGQYGVYGMNQVAEAPPQERPDQYGGTMLGIA